MLADKAASKSQDMFTVVFPLFFAWLGRGAGYMTVAELLANKQGLEHLRTVMETTSMPVLLLRASDEHTSCSAQGLEKMLAVMPTERYRYRQLDAGHSIHKTHTKEFVEELLMFKDKVVQDNR